MNACVLAAYYAGTSQHLRCVADGGGLGAFARDLMYALAFLGRRSALNILRGRYALAFLGRRSALDILPGRRGTWSVCAGSNVRFGVSGPPLCA